MQKIILANECLRDTLSSFATNDGYIPGLIVGQTSEKKGFVVNLAVTPKSFLESNYVKELENVKESWLKIHMKNVTRSLPGGLSVLGFFIIGPKDIFADKLALQKVRLLISCLHASSSNNAYLYGNNHPYLVLYFNSKTLNGQGKWFNFQNSMNVTIHPASFKFVDQHAATEWYAVETNFLMESILPCLVFSDKNLPLKKVFKDISETFRNHIDRSLCFINGHFKEKIKLIDVRTLIINQLELENDIKTLLIRDEAGHDKNTEELLKKYKYLNTFKAKLFKEGSSLDTKVQEASNASASIEFKGILSSKIFIHKEGTVDEAIKNIKEDLVRSFVARLELHCDSLEDEQSNKEPFTLHTLPRRVLAHDPNDNTIMYTEYMFPDDTKEDIANSIAENLSLKEVSTESIIDFEAPPVIVQKKDNMKTASLKISNNKINNLALGLIGAIVVLFISLVVHFTM